MTKNGIEKLLLVPFYCRFCLDRSSKNGPYCIISAYTKDYELKFTRQTNFDILISELN